MKHELKESKVFRKLNQTLNEQRRDHAKGGFWKLLNEEARVRGTAASLRAPSRGSRSGTG